jgi:hypothetical protein
MKYISLIFLFHVMIPRFLPAQSNDVKLWKNHWSRHLANKLRLTGTQLITSDSILLQYLKTYEITKYDTLRLNAAQRERDKAFKELLDEKQYIQYEREKKWIRVVDRRE